jgi:uncharacterized membrane protein YqjE
MDDSIGTFAHLGRVGKDLLRRVLTIAENRLELLMVEAQEERERFLGAILLAFAMAVFGLLACLTLTAAIVVGFWACSPLSVLLALTLFYAGTTWLLGRKLSAWIRDWQKPSASLEQLRKDRACLEKLIS